MYILKGEGVDSVNKTEYARIIANNLREIMYKNNKTQAEVARALGISKATLSSWMNGTRIPRMQNIDMLCHYFNVTRAEIMEKQLEVQSLEHSKEYYIDEETAQLAQEMFDDPDMRALFHMKRNMDAGRFKAHMNMMRELYKLEHPEEFTEDDCN